MILQPKKKVQVKLRVQWISLYAHVELMRLCLPLKMKYSLLAAKLIAVLWKQERMQKMLIQIIDCVVSHRQHAWYVVKMLTFMYQRLHFKNSSSSSNNNQLKKTTSSQVNSWIYYDDNVIS